MHIGEKIKEKRIEKNLTQAALAQKMGVKQQAISQFEKSRNINMDTLAKIAEALEVDFKELLSAEDIIKDSINILENFDPLKQEMDIAYDSMNGKGRRKAVEQVQILAQVPEFQKDKE